MATAKKKYVPGRAVQRAAISNRDKAVINPAHVLPIQVGIELAFEGLLGRCGFGDHDWRTLKEAFNIVGALDSMFHLGRDFINIRKAKDALSRMEHRYAVSKRWMCRDEELEDVRMAIAIYNEVIAVTTYNQLASACALVDKAEAQIRKNHV